MAEVEEAVEFQFTNKEEVIAWLQKNRTDKKIKEFAAEYRGDRTLRDLQVGKRQPITQGKTIIPAEKMVINLQKKIVRTGVSFLLGNAPTITANDPENEEVIQVLDILKKNRLHNKIIKFAEAVKSETISAIIFTKAGEGEEQTIKFRVYNNSQGTFTPMFDPYGDLIAFFWEFVSDEVEHIWIFDSVNLHRYEDAEYAGSDVHGFSVIPVVFLEQDNPEWWDVKEMIDRLEMLQSKLAASNNFFAFPILKLKGGIAKNEKGETESLIKLDDDGKTLLMGFAEKNGNIIESDAEFLKRDPAIDSIAAEVDNLLKFIYSVTQCPDLSFENVKGIGAISGVALELMFMDAINKAKWDEGDYSIVIERCISIIRSGLNGATEGAAASTLDEELEFNVKFNLSLPRDIKEEVMMLIEASGGKAIISRSSAVKKSPLTDDANEEIEEIEREEKEAMGATLKFEMENDDTI